MTEQNKGLLSFEGNGDTKNVRRVWHNGEWYYSIIDLIEILTDSPEPRKYWNKVKTKQKRRIQTQQQPSLFDEEPE